MSDELQALSSILDSDQISHTRADRDERAVDWGTSEENGVPPDVVVWPESTGDVAAVLSWANEERIPVTPYAAGTSLEGNAVPLEKGISLDMTRMNEIHEIRPDDLQVDVGPGIYGDEINEAVGKQGLVLPSLPSSGKISTIGGMLANDASGMKTVKYGEVADWLLEVEAVLPTGEVITAGSKATKTSSGYNLLDLLVGSEGTLGIITRATLQLAGRPEQIWGGRATFTELGDAADAIFDTIRSGVDVAKIELIDSISAEMANASLDTGLSNSPMVFLEFHANHSIEAEVEFCRTIFEAHDVDEFAVAESGPEMTDLWEARRELADAVDPFDPDLSSLTPGDVTVPISEYPEMVRYVKELGDEHDFLIPCFGHAGDGNLHYFVMVDVEDEEMMETGKQISKQIVEKAIEMNGTATGEHGVGVGKQDYLASEHGDAAVEAMRSIKQAFDPNGILNPGKVLPEP